MLKKTDKIYNEDCLEAVFFDEPVLFWD